MITTMRLSIDFNRYKKFWDDTQRNEECCGIVDAHDWMKFGGFNNTLRVPLSCCRSNLTDYSLNQCLRLFQLTDIHNVGCLEREMEYLKMKFISNGSLCLIMDLIILGRLFLSTILLRKKVRSRQLKDNVPPAPGYSGSILQTCSDHHQSNVM